MLNKEDILALAWEHSEGSGKRYTFTEESLFEFLKELKKEQSPAQDERRAFEHWHAAQEAGLAPEGVRAIHLVKEIYWQGWQARAAHPAQTEQPVATVKYGGYTTGNQLLWKRGAGLQFLQEGTELYAGAIPQLRTVAYLDIGAGGYIDLGSDLTNEQLEALPWGRHMLGIVGTYGAEGYVPAAPIAQIAQETNKI